MTRPSKRELERRVEKLEADTHADTPEYDPDPLTTEEKHALADLLDVDPWDPNDTDGEGFVEKLHRDANTDR